MKRVFLLLLTICTAGVTASYGQEAVKKVVGIEKNKGEEVKTVTITGTVTSTATGEVIPGVTVAVAGHPFSAMTDENGAFKLQVPESKDCNLLVSGPAQTGVIVALRGRDKVEIQLMNEGFNNLTHKEVLTPLGMKEQAYLTSALSVVSEDNSTSTKGTPEAILQGSVAGLQTHFRSGADGSGANLVLRGYNSIFANNNPLLVIDGQVFENQQFGVSLIEGQISTPLGCIDVRDIEQMTILKDASAIYGAKGGNGAILIQTKRVDDQATHIDVTALLGLNLQPEKLPLLGAIDAKRYLTEVVSTSGLTPGQVNALPWVNPNKPQEIYGDWINGSYYKYNQNTDWQDEIFQSGFKSQYSLNVSGGDEVAIYGLSLGFQNKDGLIEGTDFQRFNARVNALVNFTEKIRLTANMNFVYGEKNMANGGSVSNVNPIYTALVKAPFTSPYSYSEEGVASPAFEDVDALGLANPAAVTSDVVSQNSFYRFMGSYNLEVDFNKEWKLSSRFGLDFNKEREVIFYPSIGIPYANTANTEVTNEQMHGVQRMFNLSNETRLNYLKTVGENTYDATLGFRYMHFTAEDDYGHGFNSANNYYQTIGAGDKTLFLNGGALGNWNWLSFYGNFDYNYKHRYFVQAILSSDLSSRYGDDIAPIQIYPGVSAAWLISSEKWMRNADFINFLKLRASWTVSGNDDIGNYNAKRYYLSKAFLSNNGLISGNLVNNDLKPERVTKTNVGLDMAFWNDRLNLSVDLYQSKTEDLLIYSPAESFTGFASYVSNGGELENKGVELTLSARLLDTRHFSWDVSGTIAHNKNEITAISAPIETTIGGGTVLTQVGSPLGIFYGYETDGVYSTTAEAQQSGLQTMVGAVAQNFEAGDVRFINKNSDNIIDENDRVQIGDPNPDFHGGFSTVMKSHNFTLSAQFTYSVGNDIYNFTRSQLENMNSLSNQTKAVLNRWRTEGDITSMPKAVYGDPHQNSRFSDRWIEDGSFLKFKSLSLSYDVPLKGDVLTGITVYGTCENLFTWTKYKGYDPEIISSSSNNPLYHGVDAFTTPTTRTFYIGLKIGL